MLETDEKRVEFVSAEAPIVGESNANVPDFDLALRQRRGTLRVPFPFACRQKPACGRLPACAEPALLRVTLGVREISSRVFAVGAHRGRRTCFKALSRPIYATAMSQ